MTPELEAKLRQSGWFPGRHVDDDLIYAWLRIGIREFGCHIFPEAVRVLREYGGLTWGNIHFSPEGCGMRGDREIWLWWEWEVEEVLFPIAYEIGQMATFALSSTGKVYYTGIVRHYCGANIEEFLENELRGRKSVDLTHLHMTDERYEEVERIYNAIYEGDK